VFNDHHNEVYESFERAFLYLQAESENHAGFDHGQLSSFVYLCWRKLNNLHNSFWKPRTGWVAFIDQCVDVALSDMRSLLSYKKTWCTVGVVAGLFMYRYPQVMKRSVQVISYIPRKIAGLMLKFIHEGYN